MKFCFAADGSNLALQDRKIALVQGATEGLFEAEKSAAKSHYIPPYRRG